MRKFVKLLTYWVIFMINNQVYADPAVYEKYVDEIVLSLSQNAKQDLDLISIGDGGRMPNDIERIDVKFIKCAKASINEARELEVKATEKLVQLINAHEKIRPYLREYPFKANRTAVAISFQKKDGSDYTDGSVAYVTQINNMIYYAGIDPKTLQLYDIAVEPYEEALKKIQK